MNDQQPDDQFTAGMATGSDEGAPGERTQAPPAPGDGAVADALRSGDGVEVKGAEDTPGMAAAAENDAPLAALVATDGTGGAADADTPAFREPTTD